MVTMIDNQLSSLVSLALDAAGMRQQAIAQNIANANTPGYQRLSVTFEQRLQQVVDQQGVLHAPEMLNLTQYQPQLVAAEPSENAIALDQEMAQLAENTLHHQALLKVLSKHYALLSTAINEGKR